MSHTASQNTNCDRQSNNLFNFILFLLEFIFLCFQQKEKTNILWSKNDYAREKNRTRLTNVPTVELSKLF